MDPELGSIWLDACRRASAGVGRMLAANPTTLVRAEPLGRGEGGDTTVMVDAAAEQIVFAELERLHDAGHRFLAVSEERGVVDFGSHELRVIIDPIDGSVNAKRGLPHHALSIAVADGPTVGDVGLGFVHDFGPREEWSARRGGGAFLNGVALDPTLGERRLPDGRLEVLALELDPRTALRFAPALLAATDRVRVLGSLAVSMCQVAAARVDGMLNLRRTRSLDVAAAMLIVREAGGFAAFADMEDPLGAPLDLLPHTPVAGARTQETLARLLAAMRPGSGD